MTAPDPASPPPIPRASRWIAFSVLVVGATFAFVARSGLIAHDNRQLHREMAAIADTVSGHIRARVESEVWDLLRMAERWERRGGTPRQEWEADAASYIAHQPGYLSLAWIEPSGRIRWTVPTSNITHPWHDDLNGNPVTHDALARAHASQSVCFSEPIALDRGGYAFMIAIPVYRAATLEGYIAAVFRAFDLMNVILRNEMDFNQGIMVSASGIELYTHYPEPIVADALQTFDRFIALAGTEWRVRLWPSRALMRDSHTAIPNMTLAVGLVLALLLALTLHLGITASVRATALERINVELERRVADRTADLRHVNDRLLQQTRELERSNLELQQFAYVASHDLQEPLRMVSSYVQLLERRYKDRLDDDASDFIRYAVDGANRMKRLIVDLLAYSRTGTRPHAVEAQDTGRLLQDALRNLEIAIEDSHATVTHDELPRIAGDASQLVQLFQNLIGNAIKFRGEGAPRIRVTVAPDPDAAGFWRFRIEDNGIGIEPQYAERIFVIFQRLHPGDAYPGTGIGLAICRKVVERHGGRIWIDPDYRDGTAVCFTLPGAPAPGADTWAQLTSGGILQALK